MPKSRWKSPRDHEGGEGEEKACGGWNIAVMRKMRSSCTFYGISERFLESRGCIKIFNTFIQFANEVSGGGRDGELLCRAMIKKMVRKMRGEIILRELYLSMMCYLFKKKLFYVNYFCTFYNLNTLFEARNWRCEEYFQGRKKEIYEILSLIIILERL